MVIAQSEMVLAVAELQDIDSAMLAGDAAASVPVGATMPVAGSGMSALTAAHFVAHGQGDEQISAQAPAVHDLLVTKW